MCINVNICNQIAKAGIANVFGRKEIDSFTDGHTDLLPWFGFIILTMRKQESKSVVMTTHTTDLDENLFRLLSGSKRKAVLYELYNDFPSALSMCRQRACTGLESAPLRNREMVPGTPNSQAQVSSSAELKPPLTCNLQRHLVDMGSHRCFGPIALAYGEIQSPLGDHGPASTAIEHVEATLSSMKDGCSDQNMDAFMVQLNQVVQQHRDNICQLHFDADLDYSILEAAYEDLMFNPAVAQAVMKAESNAHGDQDMAESSHSSDASMTSSSIQTPTNAPDASYDDLTTNGPENHEEFIHQMRSRHATSIARLKLQFLKAKKPGKLPEHAVHVFMSWWRDNVLWPYPSDLDKALMKQATGMSLTQVSNWFMNRRKRQWIKHFTGGFPNTKKKAEDILLQKYGSLQVAKDVLCKEQ